MIRYLAALVFLVASISVVAQKTTKRQEVDYVNPLIGTAATGFAKGLDGGGTMPCVGTPFGMTNFVAQTGESKMSRMNYFYEDSSIIGFLASHQPTVWMGDYGYVSVMPQAGPLRCLPADRALPFDHATEVSTPYYYSVQLKSVAGAIRSEMAASSRCAILRFTFPASDSAHIIVQGINLDPALTDWANDYVQRIKTLRGYVKINAAHDEISGYNPDRMSAQIGPALPNFKGYFILHFSKPFREYGTWSGDSIHRSATEQYGTRMGAWISFATAAREVVEVQLATSFISVDQARQNLQKEVGKQSFTGLKRATRAAWQSALSRMQVGGVSDDKKTIFYTALFHTLQFPREMSEYGRYYSGFDDRVHKGKSYTDFSLWDTFRALHPLLTLTQPERVNDMVTAMLQMYSEGGRLPMWPNPAETNIMIGTHADPVIADAYVKGFRGFDTALAYKAMLHDVLDPPVADTSLQYGDRDKWTGFEAQAGLTYYKKIGYVPSDRTAESVSRTIEYGIDDYAVAQVARLMGHNADYDQLMQMSRNFKNLYDTSSGFLLPRRFNGLPGGKDSTGKWVGFTEGDQWTYAFGALQDIEGMMYMMNGTSPFLNKLDENFSAGHYRHDNEPGHHYIFLYDYGGQPWKTQALVRENIDRNYRNAPVGINGNEDCGQMAAWYLFGVMGFYPVVPASGYYAIGAPQCPELTLSFSAGGKPHRLHIIARNLSAENKYVQRVLLDGSVLHKPFITHAQLLQTREFTFTMGPAPRYTW